MKIEDWDESMMEIEDYQVERALTNAALDAIARAARFNTDFVIEENGVTRCLRPNETAPVRQRFVEELERINKKIAELQSRDALILNDKPKS